MLISTSTFTPDGGGDDAGDGATPFLDIATLSIPIVYSGAPNPMATLGIPNTLPGTRFLTQDGPLVFTPSTPTGDTVLIIGQALDGPVNVPQPMSAFSNLETAFGPLVYTTAYPSPDGDPGKLGTFSGNTLIKAAREAVLGGATSVLLVRVGGVLATGAPILGGTVTVTATFPGSVYNGAQILTYPSAATGTTVTCIQPATKGGTFSIGFTPLTTAETMAAAVNSDVRNNSFRLIPTIAAVSATAVSSGWPATETSTLGSAGRVVGTNGTLRDDYGATTKQALYQSIVGAGGTFDMLRGTPTNFVHIAGLYADDAVVDPAAGLTAAQTTSVLVDLANYCYTESRDSFPMIGIIGVSPLRRTDNTSIAARITSLTSTQTGWADSQLLKLSLGQFLANGIPYTEGAVTQDAGAYLCLVAGPDLVFPDVRLGTYTDSGAALYAGMLASLPVARGATNVALPGNMRTSYRLSRAQRNLLNAGVGYTGVSNVVGGGSYVTFTYQSLIPGQSKLTVTSDVSCSSRASVYGQTQHLRIVQAAEDIIEFIASDFIGQPNSASTIMAMDSQIQRGLDGMVEAGALNGGKGSGYNYTILPGTSSAGTLGQISIVLQLRPAYEILVVTTTVSVIQ